MYGGDLRGLGVMCNLFPGAALSSLQRVFVLVECSFLIFASGCLRRGGVGASYV